jgi:hypothetical protein
MRFKALILAMFSALSFPALAQDIANCSGARGQAYFPFAGVVSKDKSGWREDAISGGKIIVRKLGAKEYDIIYNDATRSGVSSRNDGGYVLFARGGSQDFSLIVVYPNATTEIYSFWRTTDNQFQYSHAQNKGGSAPVPKTSVLIGRCDYINFNLLPAN